MNANPGQRRPKKRWFQFSLRTVFLLTLLLAFVCGIGRWLWLLRQADIKYRNKVRTYHGLSSLPNAFDTFKSEVSGGACPPSDPAEAKRFFRRMYPRYVGEMEHTFAGPDEALHFWLAGPHGDGWGADPRDPFASGGTRKGPFFEFDEECLSGHVYKPFADSTDPCLYFYSWSYETSASPVPSGVVVKPVQRKSGGYVNPNSYQIHMPGFDGKFGEGKYVDDTTGYTEERWDDHGRVWQLPPRPEPNPEVEKNIPYTAIILIGLAIIAALLLVLKVMRKLANTS
jgi:hypothetical protein